MSSHLFLPYTGRVPIACEIADCENGASWICHPQGYLHTAIHLCTVCKEQAQTEEARRTAQPAKGETRMGRTAEQRFLRYPLPGILPAHQALVIDRRQNSCTLIGPLTNQCSIIEQVHFSDGEVLVLLELLVCQPLAPCPHAQLLARMTGERLESCQIALAQARESGDQKLLQSLRDLLAGMQRRLYRLGIGLVAVYEMGYALCPLVDLTGSEEVRHAGNL